MNNRNVNYLEFIKDDIDYLLARHKKLTSIDIEYLKHLVNGLEDE